MRFAGLLNQIFGKKSKVKILRLLSLYKKEATIREISREISITPPIGQNLNYPNYKKIYSHQKIRINQQYPY